MLQLSITLQGAALSADPVIAPGDLGYLTLGIVFFAIGLVTLLLTILRSASRDDSVFLFAIMSCLWGLRFMLYTDVFDVLAGRHLVGLDGLARAFTYFSGAAAFGFALAYLGRGWRSTLFWLAWASLVFALVASLVLAIVPDRDLLLPAFSVLVIVGAGLVMANAWNPDLRERIRRDGLLFGFLLSVVFFVLENLRTLGIAPVPFDLEWIGVLILYLTLGRLIAVRLFTNERRLAALNQELATARRIQNSLLPHEAPRLGGVAVTTRFVPMTQVAGDIYDFVALDEARLTVLIADVSGHGVPAALIASMVKGAFRAQHEVLERPDRVLAGMNRLLAGQLGASFVTACCVTVDLIDGVVRCSLAGHPPPLVRDIDRAEFRETGRPGLILGQFPAAEFAGTEWTIADGSRMILYTDGIPEAENPAGEQFGDAELARHLAADRDLPADRLADGLIAAARAWTERPEAAGLDDDLTLIVIDL